MNLLAMFVLGLLIGWLAEWVIDWVYWRRRMSKVTGENTTLRERITSLEAERDARPLSAPNPLLTDKDGHDNFQAIKGIGPVFSQRLHEAGITTFEELSQLTPREMEEILGTLFKRFFSKENRILAQAKEFAQQRAQEA